MVQNDLQAGDFALLRTGRLGFGTPDEVFLGRLFSKIARQFQSTLLHLTNDLSRGNIGLPRFRLYSERALRDAFIGTYSLGAISVDPWHTLTQRDISVMDRELSSESSFLRAFSRDLNRGFITLSPVVRVNLYVQALRGTFELGRLEALPTQPYIWSLGDTDHCIPCSRVQALGPLQRDRFSHLGLPNLPGIPGSGDICSGLTQCGCTLRQVNMTTGPGTAFQLTLRDLLREIINANTNVAAGGED